MPTATDVLEVIQNHSDPVVSSNEVAEELDCTGRAALEKLRTLAELNEIQTKKVGARARVFWIPSNEPSSVPSNEPSTEDEPSSVPSNEPSSELLNEITRDEWDDTLYGSGDVLDERIDAVKTAVSFIRDNDGAAKREILEHVWRLHDTEHQDPDSLWQNDLYEALTFVRDRTDSLYLDASNRWCYDESGQVSSQSK